MNCKDKLYSKYVSAFTRQVYGDVSLDGIVKQFPAWKTYFGKFLPKDKTAEILDFGCGNGGFVYWLQQIGYQNAEGIDVSKEQIETAKNLGIENIEHANGIATAGKNRFDVIFMRDVLEHFNKDEILALLEATRKSLKDNGLLIIQAPNAGNPFGGRLRYGDFTHEISFTETSIKQILSVSGFKNIYICSQQPAVHGLKSLIRAILWKLIELKIKFYLLIETGSGKGIFSQNLIAAAQK